MAWPGVHVPLRVLRAALQKGTAVLKSKLPTVAKAPILKPIPVPVHQTPHSAIRSRIAGRWYTTSSQNLLRSLGLQTPKVSPSTLARGPGPVRAALGRHTATSPWSSTLRPRFNGAMPRTAGGYSLGGGARYFSSSPAAPAQVMSQVSAAMRAFCTHGKGQMESYRRHSGAEGRMGVRAQLAASLVGKNAPGSYVEFDLTPTWTAVSPLGRNDASLENQEFIQGLGSDFGFMMGALTAVYADIKRLATLGDLPIAVSGPKGEFLRVHFRGCDSEFVETLCAEVGVKRGLVREEERFLFNLLGAPDISRAPVGYAPDSISVFSEDGFSDDESEPGYFEAIKTPDSIEALSYAEPDEIEVGVVVNSPMLESVEWSESDHGWEGLEGVHRFLEECEEYRVGSTAWR